MGPPLSGLLACIFLEFLESNPFQNINLPDLVDKLDKVEHTIEFTYKMETNYIYVPWISY